MEKRKIWLIVGLVGGYIFSQVLADVAATKLIVVWGYVIPAGTFIFAATFTLRDILHKRLGKEWTRAVIWTAAILNIFMSLYLQGMARISAPQFFLFNEEWSAIFAIVPAVVLASIVAELVSELLDTEVYHWWWKTRGDLPQWTRVLASNLVSLPIDSLLFGSLAFVLLPPLFGGQALPWAALPSIIVGQIVVKGIITLISLPTIYLVKEELILDFPELAEA